MPLGWRYGTDGFNVAHFGWLDQLQPTPSPELYVGVMLATGVLALVCAFRNAGRWTRALLVLLYTYGWTMSELDVFQHHYLLSLILATFVFFPRGQAPDLSPPRPSASLGAEPSEGAWAYVLLGTTMSIVYTYTMVTKLEGDWSGGLVIQKFASVGLASIQAWTRGRGLSAPLFWRMQALGAIVAECMIAVGYAVAPLTDRAPRRSIRVIVRTAFLAAVGLHVAAELFLRLAVGWFSYYMIAFACVYFLPERLLWRVGAWWARQAERTEALGQRTLNSVPASGAVAVAVALVSIAIGMDLDLPGARSVGVGVAALALGGACLALVRQRLVAAAPGLLAWGLAVTLMWGTVSWSGVRFDYYAGLGGFLQKRGLDEAAAAAFDRARRYGPSSHTSLKLGAANLNAPDRPDITVAQTPPRPR